jgi:hypothetical protein
MPNPARAAGFSSGRVASCAPPGWGGPASYLAERTGITATAPSNAITPATMNTPL